MSLRRFFDTLLLYALALALGFSGYLAAFHFDLLSRFAILFYRGIPVAIIVAVILFVLLLILARERWSVSEIFAAAAVSLAFNLCFLVLFPVTIDRSISVFLLARMAERPEHIFTTNAMRRDFVRLYVDEWDQIDRRMAEQIASGNVAQVGGGFQITARGRQFVRAAQKAQKLFKTDPRFVGAEPASEAVGAAPDAGAK